MDKLMDAAKDFLENDKPKQDNRQDYETPAAGANKPPGGGLTSFFGDLDFNKAKEEANKDSGSSGNSDLFSSILGSLGQKQDKLANEDIDEEKAIRMHKKTYDDDDEADERSLGTAAAMQALKQFTSGKGERGGQSGGNSQSTFLGLAMSEASKLFDDKEAKGKVPSGTSKESVVQQAGEFAMKMYFKNQAEKQGGLAGLASQFMK